MSSNIITRVRYKKDVNFQRLVGGWCKYVSKDGADGKSLKDFSSMNDLYEKEFGIFDDTKNFDEYEVQSVRYQKDIVLLNISFAPFGLALV